MRHVELLEEVSGVWKCVICGHLFGTQECKAQAQIGPHADKHFANLEKVVKPKSGRNRGSEGGGGFLDFLGDIIDAIVSD